MYPIFDTKLYSHIEHVDHKIDSKSFEKVYKVKGDKVHKEEIEVTVTIGIKDGTIYLLDEEYGK